MSTNIASPPPTNSKALVWIGRVLSTLPVLGLLMSAGMKFSRGEEVLKGMAQFGYPENILFGLAITELVCTALYVIPQTAVLGAILLTGYLGGATATHVRVGDNFAAPVIMGVMLWLGLFLRDARLRSLIPFRSLGK